MPDREKVIEGLRDIDMFIAGRLGHEKAKNFLRTIDETIALLKEQEGTINELQNAYGYLQKQFFDAQDKLLKEQEAVEPTIDEYGNKRCGSCGHKLQSIADPDLFCCKCGKPVLWEGR